MTNLTGKPAVVTGSTSGIGLAYARALALAPGDDPDGVRDRARAGAADPR